MQFVHDTFIIRRISEGRIFVCSPKMPFEFFINCFQQEHPFFLVSQLDDGRVAIVPNVMYIAQNFNQAGYGSWNLLPADCEYVTIKRGTYPMIISAHPVKEFEPWLRKFQAQLVTFARQSLWEFVESTMEFEPLEKLEKKEFGRELVTT